MANSTFAGMDSVTFPSFGAQNSAFITDSSTSTEMSLGDWQLDIYAGGEPSHISFTPLTTGYTLLSWFNPYSGSYGIVYGILINPEGEVAGDVMRLDDGRSWYQMAAAPDGGFIVYYEDEAEYRFSAFGEEVDLGDANTIIANSQDPNITALISQIDDTHPDARVISAMRTSDGEYVGFWNTYIQQAESPGFSFDLSFQVFDENLVAQSDPVQVQSDYPYILLYHYPIRYSYLPLDNGDFVLSWSDGEVVNTRQYSPDGSLVTSEAVVAPSTIVYPSPYSPDGPHTAVGQFENGQGMIAWVDEDSNSIQVRSVTYENTSIGSFIDTYTPPEAPSYPTSYGVIDGENIRHHYTDFDTSGFNMDGPTDARLADARATHAFTVGDSQFLVVVSGGDENGAMLYRIDEHGNVGEGVSIINYGARNLNEPFDVTSTTVGNKTYLLVADVDEFGIHAFEISEDGSFTFASSFTESNYDRSVLGGGTAVATADIEGQTFVFSIRPYTNGITSLKLDENGVLSLADLRNDDGTDTIIYAAHLEAIQKNGGTYLYSTGSGTAINIYSVANDGTLTPTGSVTQGGRSSADLEAVTIGGRDYLYSAINGYDRIAIYEVGANGALTSLGTLEDTAQTPLDGAYGLGSFEIDGTHYLSVASSNDNSVTFLRIGNNGQLTYVDSIIDSDIIALDRAYDVEPFVLHGTDRLFVAATAFGEGGFSIFEIGENAPLVLIGTSAAEALSGTRFGDEISGAGGHDSLSGALGDDTLSGDDGDDTVDGEDGQDSLSGGTGNDLIDGGAGQDTLIGGAGADTMDGGADQDMLDYTASTAGVMADLSRGRGRRGDAEGDRFSDIEDIAGSAHNDTLIGNAGDNRLLGGDGFDFSMAARAQIISTAVAIRTG